MLEEGSISPPAWEFPPFSLLFDSCLQLAPSVQIYLPALALRSSSIVLYDFSLGGAGSFQHLFSPVLPGSGCQSKDVALRDGDVSWEDKSPGRCAGNRTGHVPGACCREGS